LEAENVLDVCPFMFKFSPIYLLRFGPSQLSFFIDLSIKCSQIEAMLGGSAWDTMSMELNTDDPWEAETNMYFDMYTRMLADERPERRMAMFLGNN